MGGELRESCESRVKFDASSAGLCTNLHLAPAVQLRHVQRISPPASAAAVHSAGQKSSPRGAASSFFVPEPRLGGRRRETGDDALMQVPSFRLPGRRANGPRPARLAIGGTASVCRLPHAIVSLSDAAFSRSHAKSSSSGPPGSERLYQLEGDRPSRRRVQDERRPHCVDGHRNLVTTAGLTSASSLANAAICLCSVRPSNHACEVLHSACQQSLSRVLMPNHARFYV